MNSEDKSTSFRDALYVIFKWKKFITSSFLLILLGVTLITFFSPPVYQATAKVLLKRERPEIMLTTDKSENLNRPMTNKDIMAEIEIVKSRPLLEKVVVISGLDQRVEKKEPTIMAYILFPLKAIKNMYNRIHEKRELSNLEKSVYELSENLRVNEIKNSDIFEISYTSNDPERAKKIVNVLTDQYIEYRLDLYKTSQANTFFQNQLSILEDNYKKSFKALRDFQEKNSSLLSDEEKERILSRLSETELALRTTEIEEEELTQKIAFLKSEFERQSKLGIDPERLSGKTLDDLREQLISLQLKRSDLLQQYTEIHPQVIAVEREIRSIQEMIRREENKPQAEGFSGEISTKDYCSKECLAAEAQLGSTQIRKKALKEQIDYYKGKISQFQSQYYTMQELKKKVQVDEEAYNIFLEKLKESEMFMELDKMKVINAMILQYAETPTNPIKPKKAKNMLVGIILGLVLSIGSVFVVEYFNHGVKNQEDIEKYLEIKVLASIPFRNGKK